MNRSATPACADDPAVPHSALTIQQVVDERVRRSSDLD
jgi:hypothetical protein